MPLILPFSELTLAHVPVVGLKAATLGELARNNFPTPDGFCFTIEAYRLALAPLEEKILARATPAAILDPIEQENVATDIRDLIEQAAWAPALTDALTLTLASRPGAKSFIARTSMTSEELAAAFGSGVRRAFLGLVGADEVARAVSQCWATPFTSRALYYRNRKKIKQTSVDLGVLVQPMIPAQSAGMMFTLNPHSGASDELVVESIWGLGEPATSARVRPDRFVVEKSSRTVRSESIASKLFKLELAPDGHLQQLGIAEELQDAPSLDSATLARLAELGEQIEKVFGAPQEIEWAYADSQVAILQSRPIGQRK